MIQVTEMPHHRYEIHVADDWAALYIDGQLDRVGDAYLADERLREIFGVKTVDDDAFMRGQTYSEGVAPTLDDVTVYRHAREALTAKIAEAQAALDALKAAKP